MRVFTLSGLMLLSGCCCLPTPQRVTQVQVRLLEDGSLVFLEASRGCEFSGKQPTVSIGGTRMVQTGRGGMGVGHAGGVACGGPDYESSQSPFPDATVVIEHGEQTLRIPITRKKVGLVQPPESLTVHRGERISLRMRPGTTGVEVEILWRSLEDLGRRESFQPRTRIKGNRLMLEVPKDVPLGESRLRVGYDTPEPRVDCPAGLECLVTDVDFAAYIKLHVE